MHYSLWRFYYFGAGKKKTQNANTNKRQKTKIQGCISVNFAKYFRPVLL